MELRAPPTSLAFVPPLGGAGATSACAAVDASAEARPQGPALVLVSGGVLALPVSDAVVTPAQAAASAAEAKGKAQAAQACFQILVAVPNSQAGPGGESGAAGGGPGRPKGTTACSSAAGRAGVSWRPVPLNAAGFAHLEAAACSLGIPLEGAARGEEAWEDASRTARDAMNAWHQELCKREYSIPERELRKRKRNDRRLKAKA